MGELHPLAYTSSSLGWDFHSHSHSHNLGVPNADTMSLDEPRGTSISRISEEAANTKTPEEAPEATDSSSSSYNRDLANTKSINCGRNKC
ncbi:hypothetical protein FH972_027138 [Carpinus fangiana]|uniref:Uncharacterized protein n=1 Tax=Carpinus fangiana TaxID=176857 RepID=A0A5N6L635_9ROSI|nr:hypothetical protein FH972_027138 [Carpinus fangiana]